MCSATPLAPLGGRVQADVVREAYNCEAEFAKHTSSERSMVFQFVENFVLYDECGSKIVLDRSAKRRRGAKRTLPSTVNALRRPPTSEVCRLDRQCAGRSVG